LAEKELQTDESLWYKDAIIYELHVKSFYDSNGDGIGDFGGVIQRLDYLQELGVTALWLLPFYPSPPARRRLRHRRLPAHPPGLRHAGGLQASPARGAQAGHPHHHRAGHQPHVEPARVVSALPTSQAGIALAGLLRLERHDRAVSRRPDHLHRLRELQLGLGPRRPGLLLAPVLQPPAGPELR
jgi:hypothetical protein